MDALVVVFPGITLRCYQENDGLQVGILLFIGRRAFHVIFKLPWLISRIYLGLDQLSATVKKRGILGIRVSVNP